MQDRVRLLLVLFIFVAVPAMAANHFVRDGATGNGSGSDWTNACDDFTGACAPSALVRGDTYYVADGTYGRVSFNRAESGNTLITIQKATIADHGSNVGWNDTFGDGQARWFSGSSGGGTLVNFGTGFWKFNGVTGGGPGSWKTGFGFVVDSSVTGDTGMAVQNGNVTISHTEIIGVWDGNGSGGANDGIFTNDDNVGGHILFEYLYVHHQGRVSFFIRSHNTTIQYSWAELNENTPVEHSEGISAWRENGTTGTNEVQNLVIRYNVWKDIEGTGGIVCDCNGWDVYGNVFWGTGDSGTGHGAVTGWTQDDVFNTRVFNNTFIDANKAVMFSTSPGGSRGNITVYNNIIFDTAFDDTNVDDHDHNWFFSAGGTHGEPNGQAGSGNPFVNINADNFHLVAATNPGRTLAPPFNVDPDGKSRGSDGVWDRGAFEFGGTPPPPPPAGLTNTVR